MDTDPDMRALAARFLELWQAQAEATIAAAAQVGDDGAGHGDGKDRPAAALSASRRR
ncbi:MAG TPA: hypothetical protein QF813_10315 [Alphaproteobacteria bacterium]|nr:hypothetical protein [Alphaproteobacteria bacterium]